MTEIGFESYRKQLEIELNWNLENKKSLKILKQKKREIINQYHVESCFRETRYTERNKLSSGNVTFRYINDFLF